MVTSRLLFTSDANHTILRAVPRRIYTAPRCIGLQILFPVCDIALNRYLRVFGEGAFRFVSRKYRRAWQNEAVQQTITAEQQRRQRADQIVRLLACVEDMFSVKSQAFLRVIRHGSVSPRQLRWLEDLREQYL